MRARRPAFHLEANTKGPNVLDLERCLLTDDLALVAGLCATINSDDPAYFGGYLNQNFIETFAALPQLTARHAHRLAANKFEASFAGADDKLHWAGALDAAFAAVARQAQ